MRNTQKLASSSSHHCDCLDDVLSPQCNVLNSSSSPVVDVFLNLRLSLSWSWLVDWHFNYFIEICHDDASQGWVFCMHHCVVDRPKSVEIKHFLIPLSSCFHFIVWLISNTVINYFENWSLNQIVERLCKSRSLESRQEWSVVIYSLD